MSGKPSSDLSKLSKNSPNVSFDTDARDFLILVAILLPKEVLCPVYSRRIICKHCNVFCLDAQCFAACVKIEKATLQKIRINALFIFQNVQGILIKILFFQKPNSITKQSAFIERFANGLKQVNMLSLYKIQQQHIEIKYLKPILCQYYFVLSKESQLNFICLKVGYNG